MSAAHTPSPWRAAELPCGNIMVEGSGGRSIATFQTKSLKREGWAYAGHLANARLMASAPDLLAAALAVMSQHDKPIRDGKTKERFEALRAAIGKATTAIEPSSVGTPQGVNQK